MTFSQTGVMITMGMRFLELNVIFCLYSSSGWSQLVCEWLYGAWHPRGHSTALEVLEGNYYNAATIFVQCDR